MRENGSRKCSVREARAEEASAILELWRQSDATPSVTDNKAAVDRAIALDSSCVLVAESNGEIVGSIIGTFDGWRGNIYRLTVHPTYRRRGVARALVAGIETQLSRMGALRITALVEREHPWAIKFWEAAGYQLDPRMVRYAHNL